MKHFYLFRHGQTDWNKERRFQGRADIPLNATGIKQAHELTALLKPKNLEIIVASPLKRAYATAEVIAQALGIEIKTDGRLMEVDFGIKDGIHHDELMKRLGADFVKRYLASWDEADLDQKLPGGETKRLARDRALDALTEIAQTGGWTRIGVACHGMIMLLVMGYAGIDKLYSMGNGDIAHLIYTEEGEWKFHNYIYNPLKTGGIF